jgi:ADP-heptose:LPS heptosyltransferase
VKLLKGAAKGAKYAALFCIDTLSLLKRRVPLHPSRILMIRLDAIGDFVLWLPAAKATVSFYREQGKTVVLLANAAWATWAKELGMFDDVIALDRRKFDSDLLYRYQIEYRVGVLGCSIAIQPTYSREWLFGDAIIRTCGAQERIGSAGDTSNSPLWQMRIADRWYTRLISANPVPYMELVRNAEFVRGLGKVDFLATLPDLHKISGLQVNEAFIAATAGDLRYYALFPGASWNNKRWPIASFAQVAARIYRQTGWRGVVCGGPTDVELAEKLCNQSDAPLLNWAGRTDLMQLASILSEAQMLVTNDTVATHIAAACGVPTVCILGGGHYGRFMPYQVEQIDSRPLPRAITHRMPCFGCNWHCIYGDPDPHPMPCIDQITVSQVWCEISEILELVLGKGRSEEVFPVNK